MSDMINDSINEKLQFFLDNGVKAHIKLKTNTFFNAYILKKIKEGVWQINDERLGPTFIFLTDIADIQEYKNMEEIKKEENDGKVFE